MFTSRELATVLAALRTVQGTNGGIPGAFSSMPQFDEDEPLTVGQIDELCERLNAGEDPDGLTAEQRESLRDQARAMYAADSDDDIEIDDMPEFSVVEDGVWVSAWVWIAKDEEEDTRAGCGNCGGDLGAAGVCGNCGGICECGRAPQDCATWDDNETEHGDAV